MNFIFSDELCQITQEDVSKAIISSENDEKPKAIPSVGQMFSELHSSSKQLPQEWMVVQIAKRFDVSIIGATNRKIVCKDTGLLITLFRYPRWELNDKRPLVIVVPSNEGNKLFQEVLGMYEILKENLMYNKEKDSGEYRQKYWSKLNELEVGLEKLVGDQVKWFENWRFLLSGCFKETEDKCMESKLYTKIDQYCKQRKCTTEFRIVVSLLARRIDLMSHEGIYGFCCHYAEDDDDLKKMFMFLIEIQKSFKINSPRETYPCVLVVDEMLDMMLWEMLNTDQDFCRFSSFHLLMTLFKKHSDEIKNGYWQTKIGTGCAVVNPEKNLPDMQQRMVEYFDYCMPNWKKIVAETPTKETFADILTSNDIFVYCGHGSGLQFIKDYYLMHLKIRSVTFLFGCSSGKLNSKGMWSEMHGSHTYYAAGLCPGVFGMLFVVTDYLTDVMSSIILCRWIPNPECKRSWRETFKKHWRGDNYKQKDTMSSELEQNLLRIITDLRREKHITMRQRAAMCYRGLPAWNNF